MCSLILKQQQKQNIPQLHFSVSWDEVFSCSAGCKVEVGSLSPISIVCEIAAANVHQLKENC